MKKFVKAAVTVALVSGVAFLSGCAGQVYNKSENCSYNYLLHPAISVSRVVGGCGPVGDLSRQQ
ncbi:DUF4223 family protein [Pseudomonas sp. MWU13-3659]|uniref:DUF4223 family protein n=1 Tax=Pseudomonas sp. MWU13-3659 TaxID=2986964 RepID=UPI002075A550|nr:DUF4223 family protein [Pseudomonas sp. MWU13-3659]